MSNKSIFLLPVLFCLLALSPLQPDSVHAQDASPIKVTKDKSVFEIDFPGGPLDEYVKFLRTCPYFDNEDEPIPVNILVTASAKNFQLPEIMVTTNMDGALGLLEICSDENSQLIIDLDSSGNIMTIRVMNDERPTVTVINAKKLLLSMEEKDLLEVIDVGLDMQGNTSKVELKLHQKTGLLFAKGTERATELVHNIVNELTGNSNVKHFGSMGGMESSRDMGDMFGGRGGGGKFGGFGVEGSGPGGRGGGFGAGAPAKNDGSKPAGGIQQNSNQKKKGN